MHPDCRFVCILFICFGKLLYIIYPQCYLKKYLVLSFVLRFNYYLSIDVNKLFINKECE